MKKFIIQAIILLIVIFGALAISTSRIPTGSLLPQPPKYGEVLINNNQITVEVADTQQKRTKGLGGRETLASDSGMLFIFDESKKYSFWMKGLKFPLDFIWIRGNEVVDILENIPPPSPGQPDKELPVYQSNQPIEMVLEVNAGYVSSHGIQVGDKVSIVIK